MNIIYIFQCYTLNLNTAAKIIIDTFQSFFCICTNASHKCRSSSMGQYTVEIEMYYSHGKTNLCGVLIEIGQFEHLCIE